MERIDDLQINGLKLIQNDEEFCFGTDSIELANFVEGTNSDHAIDLGSGNGIIAILLAGKKGIKTVAVEINEVQSRLAQKNVQLNGLQHMVDVLNIPMQKIPDILKSGSQTIVVSNPPYFKKGSGLTKKGNISLARHEVAVTLKEILDIAAYLLSTGGRLYMVYTTDRLAELLHTCIQKKLQPKQLVVLNAKNKDPHLCLLKCVKDAKTGLKVTARLVKDFGMS